MISTSSTGTLQSGRRLTLTLHTTLAGHTLPVNDIVVPKQGSSVRRRDFAVL